MYSTCSRSTFTQNTSVKYKSTSDEQAQFPEPTNSYPRQLSITSPTSTQSMLRLLPSPSHRHYQIRLSHLFTTWEIPSGNLRIDLHARVGWDKMVCKRSVRYELRNSIKRRGCIPRRGYTSSQICKYSPGISYLFQISIPLFTIASYFISLIDTILSTFFIPNQCRTSGINAWNLISLTPAINSVDLKYLSAESPPRFRRL